jgi:ABC-2 type transport system ATP-binding protein
MPDAISIAGLTKTFGSKVAVRDLDLAIPEGTLCGLIGPNGAGKTTIIRMVMSIIFPDRGRIEVLGRTSAVESKDRIGYLPEERGLYRKMRVAGFLSYIARLKGVDPAAVAPRVRAWLERVDLLPAARKRCEELSKGMQQKVQFVASIIHEPDLLILDEPFSGLDPVSRRLMRSLIEDQHEAGRTIIFSTHAMHEAEALCDRVVMIHRGEKVLDAGMETIRSRFDPRTVEVELMEHAQHESLGGIPGVDRVAAQRRGHVDLHLRDGADPRITIAQIVAALPVRRVELKRVTLDDVFINLVEEAGVPAPAREELRAAIGGGTEATSD